ncbi:MAG: hypothetical protein NDI69_11995 [Bacteriovoracaceae bacterium]|nr:hypothetical protein [Bacteriovoracaceae bacterium]
MKRLTFYFVMMFYFLPALSYALTCSINGTDVIFVNGIMNDSRSVDFTRKKMSSHLVALKRNIDRTSILAFDTSYNESVDLITDFLESWAQSIESKTNGLISFDTAFVALYRLWFALPRTDPINTDAVDSYYLENYEKINQLLDLEKHDVTRLVSKIKDKILLDDRKVLIVSHSQGNFFANKALLQLSELPDFDYEKYKGIIGNIRVASPVSKVIADYSVLVQNSADVILKVPGAPAANYFLYVPHPDYDIRSSAEDKKNNHSFIETYMFDLAAPGELYYNENQSLVGLRKRTIKAITDTAAKLRPHPSCPYCTDTFFN